MVVLSNGLSKKSFEMAAASLDHGNAHVGYPTAIVSNE